MPVQWSAYGNPASCTETGEDRCLQFLDFFIFVQLCIATSQRQ